MEGAGASIVNDDAELATRGMDSGDEEPEVSSAVQDLLRQLEGKSEPLLGLPTLIGQEFREFFPEHGWRGSMGGGWRNQVRLRVLKAIGTCNTFKHLDFKYIFRGDISRLTASEWQVVFRGFMSSTALRAIRVEGLTWTSLADVESLCEQLGRILKTSSVEVLTIGDCRLSARCFSSLASGLRGNEESKLEYLEVRNPREDPSAVKHVADIISSAVRLKTLEIGGSSFRMYDMDEEAVRILSQAIIKSSSLKKLVLDAVKGEASAFLLKALDVDDDNRALECLHLMSMSGVGDCLRELLRSNPYLKELKLTDIDMHPETWRQLGQAIRESGTARTINVVHFVHHKDNLKGVEEFACAASSDIKEPTVEMIITVYEYNALMSAINFVGRVLLGKIKSLKSLILYMRCPCPSGSNHDRMEMDAYPGEISVLKRLGLPRKGTLNRAWKDLLSRLRENTSVTHLDLSKSEVDEEAFRDVMDLLQVNLILQEINVSETSWAKDGSEAHIHEALKHNQKRAVYMTVFRDRDAKLSFGDAKAGRLFLCGSPGAGKTKLRQTLMRIVQGKSWLGNKWEELWRTQCIELKLLQNNQSSKISIWDCAGQEISRSLQTMLFPQTSNFCIFLFVYNPFCEKTSCTKPESCFQTELNNWLSFIKTNSSVKRHNLPQVFVVISHKDKVRSSSLTWTHSIVEELTQRFANFVDLHPIEEWSHVDARKKKQVKPLKNHIFEIFQELLREKSPRVPHLCYQIASLLVTKTKEKKNYPIWSFKKFHDFCDPSLKHFIPTYSAHYNDHSRIMRSVISYLNDIGFIIHIPNVDYIIVDPNWLTNTFFGELLTMGQHFQASPYTSKYGFVSDSVFARWKEQFLRKQPRGQKGVNSEMLENILIKWDLCFKQEGTPHYFIPCLVPEHASMELHAVPYTRLGQAIPDREDLKSDILSQDGISDDAPRAILKGGESKELQEAWLRIQQTLAPQLQDGYSAIFKLYQVKYVKLELGGHAWVCEECMIKGRSSGILTY